MGSNRCVISGIGLISPLALHRVDQWKRYGEGATAFTSKSFGGLGEVPVATIASEGEERLASLRRERSSYEEVDRTVLLALSAARAALADAKLEEHRNEVGVFLGSSRGATQLLEESIATYLQKGAKAVPVPTSPLTTLGNIATWVAQDLLTEGAAVSHSITCSTALHGLGNAIAWIRSGMGSTFLVGGSEAPLTGFTLAQMQALRIYSKYDPHEYPCRPFEQSGHRKSSLTLGEGACVFAVEDEDSFLERASSASSYAVIEGFGTGVEAIASCTAISNEGIAFQGAMRAAMASAHGAPPPDLIIAHAPGTKGGDEAELHAIRSVFGDSHPQVYAPKWHFGHTFGASGAFGIEYALYCLQGGKRGIPPFPQTTRMPDEERDIRRVMVNAAGFGGNACSVILQR